MKRVMNEFYCRSCEHTENSERRIFKCPKCGSSDVFNCSFVTCDCGTIVYLSNPLTNFCSGCDRMYNGCGQELAPISEWDDDDVYDCFGPQAESEVY